MQPSTILYNHVAVTNAVFFHQRPFDFSQFHWNGNCSEKEAYAQLSSVCEVLEYIDTLNELHTDYKNKYSGSRLTQVAALIAASKQVQKTACNWVSQYVCNCEHAIYSTVLPQTMWIATNVASTCCRVHNYTFIASTLQAMPCHDIHYIAACMM